MYGPAHPPRAGLYVSEWLPRAKFLPCSIQGERPYDVQITDGFHFADFAVAKLLKR
jgi:hypothetical protein